MLKSNKALSRCANHSTLGILDKGNPIAAMMRVAASQIGIFFLFKNRIPNISQLSGARAPGIKKAINAAFPDFALKLMLVSVIIFLNASI